MTRERSKSLVAIELPVRGISRTGCVGRVVAHHQFISGVARFPTQKNMGILAVR